MCYDDAIGHCLTDMALILNVKTLPAGRVVVVCRSVNILQPLVVLTQLTQYWRYLAHCRERVEDRSTCASAADRQAELFARHLAGRTSSQTLGFCTGLLSAFAVSTSRNKNDLQRYSAVAVRLAMRVGAVVDSQEAPRKRLGHGKSQSFATAWRNEQEAEVVSQVVEGLFPDTYASDVYDEARATIATLEHKAAQLVHQLRTAGITVADVELGGRFHYPDPETSRVAASLVEMCDCVPDLQFPQGIIFPSYTNEGNGKPIDLSASIWSGDSNNKGNKLHAIALHAILVDQCRRFPTLAKVSFPAAGPDGEGHIISFGPDRCVPPSLDRKLGPSMLDFTHRDSDVSSHVPHIVNPKPKTAKQQTH